MDEYIKRKDAVDILQSRLDSISSMSYLDMDWHELDIMRNVIENTIDDVGEVPSADVQPVKHEQRIDHEKLIGIFGTLCDYMVDNCRCDVFCPYAETKDKNGECEAWRTIQKIRQEG